MVARLYSKISSSPAGSSSISLFACLITSCLLMFACIKDDNGKWVLRYKKTNTGWIRIDILLSLKEEDS
ncbi:MAG: hypothetical protein HRU36_03220 [Rickettsiales bacterium]|nr:hypothetical protein [Rickettsiales bacterium]